jgi:hypothetical protein
VLIGYENPLGKATRAYVKLCSSLIVQSLKAILGTDEARCGRALCQVDRFARTCRLCPGAFIVGVNEHLSNRHKVKAHRECSGRLYFLFSNKSSAAAAYWGGRGSNLSHRSDVEGRFDLVHGNEPFSHQRSIRCCSVVGDSLACTFRHRSSVITATTAVPPRHSVSSARGKSGRTENAIEQHDGAKLSVCARFTSVKRHRSMAATTISSRL